MQLQLQTFATLVGNAAAAVQGGARALVDLTVGSTLRALLEANASVALWMQWLILQVLQATRAATSAGADLDSWMADFTVVRLPATAARGQVSFSRFVPFAPARCCARWMARSLSPWRPTRRMPPGTPGRTATRSAPGWRRWMCGRAPAWAGRAAMCRRARWR